MGGYKKYILNLNTTQFCTRSGNFCAHLRQKLLTNYFCLHFSISLSKLKHCYKNLLSLPNKSLLATLICIENITIQNSMPPCWISIAITKATYNIKIVCSWWCAFSNLLVLLGIWDHKGHKEYLCWPEATGHQGFYTYYSGDNLICPD